MGIEFYEFIERICVYESLDVVKGMREYHSTFYYKRIR